MAMMLMMALGMALMLTTHDRDADLPRTTATARKALYAADAAVERVMDDILTVPDWNDILTGDCAIRRLSTEPTTGTRHASRRPTIDLAKATNMLNCGKTDACSRRGLRTSTPTSGRGA